MLSWGYKHVIKPVAFRRDPEDVHNRLTAIGAAVGNNVLGRLILKALFSYHHPMLRQEIAGIKFPNPVGLAAGFDKNAQLTRVLPCIGFGHAELGSITGEYCPGNPRPRVWRLPLAKSLIIYYGLKNDGAEAVSKRLQHKQFLIPIGISAAKTNCKETVNLKAGIADYCKVLECFRGTGDYYTINISCPNSFGGLDFADSKRLEQLLREIKQRKLFCKPVFIKLSPDLSTKELDTIITLSLKYGITGLICSNLIKKREHAAKLSSKDLSQWTVGGISGKPVMPYALKQVAYIYRKTHGRLVVVGCGGIFCAEDAYTYIRHGASLVQLITGMIYEGPQLISSINAGLVDLLKKDGFSSVSDAIGKDV